MNQGTILGSPAVKLIALAALVAVLLALLSGGLLQAQGGTTVEYMENSTDSVLTLSAGDPEGATPVTWSLVTEIETPNAQTIDGVALTTDDIADSARFKIDPRTGVLEFMSPPDFDAPGDAGTNNTYNVVVQASDGDAGNNAATGTDVTDTTDIEPGVNMVDNDDTRSWFKVIVNVQDVNEPGSLRIHHTDHALSTLLQPQIGVEITAAALTDVDGDAGGVTGATYKWQRSSGPSGPWTDIVQQNGTLATGTTYTPQQAVTGDDLGHYLQVVATYTEAGTGGRGGQTARAKSMYPTIQVVGDNNAPSFAESAVARAVRENSPAGTNIGQPVVATNPESGPPHNEKLTYWLSEATSAPSPLPPGIPAGVTVTATDAGTLGDLFSIDPATGRLMTETSLDSETAPYYVVTVNVADSSDNNPANTADIPVVIRVLQANDDPTISGAATIEHVEGGTALDTNLGNDDLVLATDVATYDATDEDPTNTTLTFSLSGADMDLFKLRDTTAAEEAADDTPTTPPTTRKVLEFKDKPDYENPSDANGDNVYEVTVEVFDGEATATRDVTVKVTNMQEEGEVEVAPVQARIGIELTAELSDSDIVSYGPMWGWQRSLGPEASTACADKDAETNDWVSIPGSGSAMFTPRAIDLGYCLRATATYNDGYHEYVTASTTPASSPGASGLYTAADTRFDKTANKTLSSVQYPTEPNITPMFGSAMTKRFVLENAAVNNPVGNPVTATDGNGPEDALAYTLGGATDEFMIHPVTGQLTTKMEFNHESKDKYTVTVTATDTHNAKASITVNVYVVDVDEGPDGDTPLEGGIPYPEDETDPVLTLSVSDPEGATPVTWSLVTEIETPNAQTIDGVALTTDDIADSARFKIDPRTGVLEFMSPPDFDAPGDAGTNNTYNVVVQASDGDAGNNAATGTDVTDTTDIEPGVNMVDNDDTRSWFKVIVNVQDVNEPGSLRIHHTDHALSTLLQPQIEVEITAAALTDVDGDAGGVTGATYKWQRSSGPNGPWTDITLSGVLVTGTTYTPQQVVTGEDLGKYLQVEATYTEDGTGGRGGQTARAKSMYPTIQVVGDNTAPSFAEGASTSRAVRENSPAGTNISLPVVATNPESGPPHNEKLTYWLSEATSAPSPLPPGIPAGVTVTATDAGTLGDLFSIDPATGQLMTETSLDSETAPYYVVTVNVADSSDNNPANTADIPVVIRVLQANDDPTISGAATIEHVEGGTALDTNLGNDDLVLATDVATYDATDEDPTNTTLTFSLSGADMDLFKLRDTTAAEEAADDTPTTPPTTRKVLEFKDKPDYENPSDANGDNVYEVTVEVFDGEATATRDVTVKVTNMQEEGEVEVAPVQARIGIELTAELSDSDIVSYGPMWGWQRSLGPEASTACADKDAETNDWVSIPGSGSAMFTPRAIDLGYCLRATATYNDGYHEYVTASTTPASSPGASGLYTAADTRFDKTANKTLSSVQYPTEPNITPMFGSAMTKRFVLENAAVNNPVGNPVTATDGNGPDDALEYTLGGATDEFSISPGTGQLLTKMEFKHESKDKYTVTVTATDTHNAKASITVNIYVVDVDEMPEILEGGLSISGSASVSVAENSPVADAVGTYTASGIDAASATWTKGSDDADDFTVDGSGASVMLKFSSSPNYEAPADADGDNVYEVTLKATDGTYMDTHNVTVMVTNVDELGALSGDESVTYAENSMDTVATYTASGPMADMATWTTMGADASHFTSTGGMLKFKSAPDYEMPRGQAMSDANTNTYMVTVKASAGGEMDTLAVTIMVTNEEEDGTVTLMPTSPVVDVSVTATLTDPDGGITGTTWQWAKHEAPTDGSMPADDSASWMDISETSESYTPVDADEGMYLRAMATYNDGYDTGNTAMAVSASAVTQLAVNGETAVDHSENVATVGTYTASASSVTWSVSGDDAGQFSISSGGVLSFNTAPDFENPADTGGNNVYNVTVVANDGNTTADLDVVITVTDVSDERPAAVQKYDRNETAGIQIDELFEAIDDYFDGDLSISELFEVIDAYFG